MLIFDMNIEKIKVIVNLLKRQMSKWQIRMGE